MRKESYSSDSYVHVTKRGARGMPIVRDDSDRWRFLRVLRYLNDRNLPRQWERDLDRAHLENGFLRPEHWDQQDPYVQVLAFCLVENHFHLLLKELCEDGIRLFMQKVGDSMTGHFNKKYGERGSIFQGAYHLRVVQGDAELLYVTTYIQVKNALDALHVKYGSPGVSEETLMRKALSYRFSSLHEYMKTRSLHIVSPGILNDMWGRPEKVRKFSLDFIEGRRHLDLYKEPEDVWMV